MMGSTVSLETLYDRFDIIAEGRAPESDSAAAHQAILARLAQNRQQAEASGWSALSLERRGGTGRIQLGGTPPSGQGRDVVPESLDARGRPPLPVGVAPTA